MHQPGLEEDPACRIVLILRWLHPVDIRWSVVQAHCHGIHRCAVEGERRVVARRKGDVRTVVVSDGDRNIGQTRTGGGRDKGDERDCGSDENRPPHGPHRSHAQYGFFRCLYAESTAVTASPAPVTTRMSFPGYVTMSPQAKIPGTEVRMSAVTLIRRSCSTFTPHRRSMSRFGAKPTWITASSTSRIDLSSVWLS